MLALAYIDQKKMVKNKKPAIIDCRLLMYFHVVISGEGGSRTLGTVSRTSV